MRQKQKYVNLDFNTFPPSHVVWATGKSFKNTNNKIKFDHSFLAKKDSESCESYFKRIGDVFKHTTLIHVFNTNTYTVKGETKTYTVVARNEIIARLLCQIEENKYTKYDTRGSGININMQWLFSDKVFCRKKGKAKNTTERIVH